MGVAAGGWMGGKTTDWKSRGKTIQETPEQKEKWGIIIKHKYTHKTELQRKLARAHQKKETGRKKETHLEQRTRGFEAGAC